MSALHSGADLVGGLCRGPSVYIIILPAHDDACAISPAGVCSTVGKKAGILLSTS